MIGVVTAMGVLGVVGGFVLDRLRREREQAEAELDTPEPAEPAEPAELEAVDPAEVVPQLLDTPAEPPKPAPATSQPPPSKKSCPEISPQHSDPPKAAPELRGSPEPGRCLIGIRPDAGLTLRGVPPPRWPVEIGQLFADTTKAQRPLTLGGRSVLCRRRGETETLELHIPGRIKVFIHPKGKIDAIMGARSADAGVGAWLRDELAWAAEILGVEAWRVVKLPLCAEFVGLPLKTAEVNNRDRWAGVKTGKNETYVHANPGDGEWLGSLYIGGSDHSKKNSKKNTRRGDSAAFKLKLYVKSRQLGKRALEASTLTHRWREAGYVDGEPVLRVELEFNDEGLQLRPRGQDGEALGFDDPATLTDSEALARLFAYGVGHPEQPKSGRYRLLTPEGEVDPRWRVVQAATLEAPFERLSQVRAGRKAERRARQQRAERQWIDLSGEVARFEGHGPGDARGAREFLGRKAMDLRLPVLEQALVRADALFADLLEDESFDGENKSTFAFDGGRERAPP